MRNVSRTQETGSKSVACPLPLTAPDLGAGYRSMSKTYTTFGGVAPVGTCERIILALYFSLI